jgi:hypothetical protein
VDGVLWAETRQALIRFQEREGIEARGVIDERTYVALGFRAGSGRTEGRPEGRIEGRADAHVKDAPLRDEPSRRKNEVHLGRKQGHFDPSETNHRSPAKPTARPNLPSRVT